MQSSSVNAMDDNRGFRFILDEMKPRGKFLTPFNVISIPVILVGLVILYFRFTEGLGSVTNLSQEFPWGFWIGFDVVTGVALAGGAYVITFVVYVMKVEKYHSIVRVTVLNGLLAYTFYAGALLLELGRPWYALNPYIGNAFGFSSVLFLICWHFALYMVAAFIEFSPVIAEWLNLEKARKFLKNLTLATVILGVTLSLLHQSGLGALFLMAKPKIHPLWWTEFIPVLFFVSSIFAGLSMVIFEGSISHRVFHNRISPELALSHDAIVVGLSRIAGAVMFVYLFLEALKFVHGQLWREFGGAWGAWYLVEVAGLIGLPMLLLLFGSAKRHLGVIRVGAALAVLVLAVNLLGDWMRDAFNPKLR